MKHQPAAYVEYFDRLEFPNLDERHSYLNPGTRAKRQPVVLGPDDGLAVEEGGVQLVIQGQVRVAEAVVRAWLVGDSHPLLSAIETWIAEAQLGDQEDLEARQQWLEELASNAAIRNELYDRAGLSVPQLLAMRLVYGNPPMTTREAAVKLHISQSALVERLEHAKEQLRLFLK